MTTTQTLQISNNIFCDEFIANLKLETRLMPNPYHDYPYLIIKNFLSKKICSDIANYTSTTSKAEKAKIKTRILNGIVKPSVHESIRKTAIHTLPNVFLEIYDKQFKFHQAQIEKFFSVALTTSTDVQTLEYTKNSFYIKHADDSSEVIDKNGNTVGFIQVAPERKLSSVLFCSSCDKYPNDKYTFNEGELMFNYLYDKQGNQIKFYPEAGDMIIFPSNPIFSHEVLNVKDGYRITCVQWHNALLY